MEPENDTNEPLMAAADICIEEFDIARSLLDEGVRLIQELYKDTDTSTLYHLSKESYAAYLRDFANSYIHLASARAMFETQVREWDAQDDADGLYEDDDTVEYDPADELP